ncbi:MAG: hypothetical protein ACLSHC_10355 [Bilophila wadsworthia]
MPGGEYILRRDYSTIPSTLILCRVLARCHHVRDELDNIRHQALAESWHPLIQGLAECSVSKNVVCSLDIAGLTGRRHQSVTRAIERRMKQRSYFLPAKSRYVAPSGLRSGMYIMKPEDAFHVLDFMKGDTAEYAYSELQDALVSCGVLWFKPDPWTPGAMAQYDFGSGGLNGRWII